MRALAIAWVVIQLGLLELIPTPLRPWYIKVILLLTKPFNSNIAKQHPATRLRLALEQLGPVWIKFGQMLSTRRDLLSEAFAQELAKLQDQVKPFPGEQAIALIKQSLGDDCFETHFINVDTTPLASASIAQVHTATLLTDQRQHEVVIKVLRPDIEPIIQQDLKLMSRFANIVTWLVPDGKRLRPKEVVKEYRKTLLDELDLTREASNAIVLRRNFEHSDALYIPHVYSEFSRKNVLVMERIYGIPVADIATLNQHQVNLKRLAEKGVEVFFTQVFRDSFFHADMHPGNIFVACETPQDPKYIGIDCGIVGTLNKEDKRYLAENFIAFFNRDYNQVAQLHVDSGWVPADTNVEEFECAIRTVCEPIFAKPLAEISFGHVLVNLFNTARRFNMQVQPQLVLLQKTLLYVEGLGRQLYPQLDLWQTAKPFLENWMKQQIGPQALWRQVKANLPFWSEKFPEIPDLIYQNLKRQQHPQPSKPAITTPVLVGCTCLLGFILLSGWMLGQQQYGFAAGFAGVSIVLIGLLLSRRE